MSEFPDWVQDAVFYQIFPDRFASSDCFQKPSFLEEWKSPPTLRGFKGGDLYGVVEKLDYLVDLGITAIYLNPIFQSTANHRYHTCDYLQVDPLLGGQKALQVLLDEAHQRNMRIILDGVFNHTGRGFYQFNHIVENGDKSPYRDWFLIEKYPLRPYHARKGNHGYHAWWGIPDLPKLNMDCPAVRQFIWDVACHWIKFGIDGWRLDVPEEINDPIFWQTFRKKIKELTPSAYIVGEIWHEAAEWLRGDQFDAITNYLLTRSCIAFFVGQQINQKQLKKTSFRYIEPMNGHQFLREIYRLFNLYPGSITTIQLNHLGSHDLPRFRTIARHDDSCFKLALFFMVTYPGAPCIYYGDEIGMEGGQDPDSRGAFLWDQAAWNRELYNYVKTCLSLRRRFRTLRRGSFVPLFANDRVIGYFRRCGHDCLLIFINTGLNSETITVHLNNEIDLTESQLKPIFPFDKQQVTIDGKIATISLEPRSGTLFQVISNSETQKYE